MIEAPGSDPSIGISSQRERSLVARVFAGFAILYLVTVSGHYSGDGFLSYLTAESLVLDGDLAILDRPFAIAEMSRGTQVAAAEGADGRRYHTGNSLEADMHMRPSPYGLLELLLPQWALLDEGAIACGDRTGGCAMRQPPPPDARLGIRIVCKNS